MTHKPKTHPYTIGKQAGVTLLELLIGLVIVGVVLTVAVPAAQTIMIKNRIVSDINEMSGVIQFARANAVDEQLNTVVCPTNDFSSCTTNWGQAKMVFGDENGDGTRNADEELLVATSLISANNTVSGPAQSVVFLANGSANTFAELLICHKDKEATYARMLTVTPQGRVRISQDGNKDGVHEDTAGTKLSCV